MVTAQSWFRVCSARYSVSTEKLKKIEKKFEWNNGTHITVFQGTRHCGTTGPAAIRLPVLKRPFLHPDFTTVSWMHDARRRTSSLIMSNPKVKLPVAALGSLCAAFSGCGAVNSKGRGFPREIDELPVLPGTRKISLQISGPRSADSAGNRQTPLKSAV